MRSPFFLIALLFVFCLAPVDAFPNDFPEFSGPVANLGKRSTPLATKASRDTVKLIGPWGSGAQVNGQFEDENGSPAWNGWTHSDHTQPTTSHWHISDYQAFNLPGGTGNLAAWCGDLNIPACSEEDLAGGYGNNWHEIIEWVGLVDDNNLAVDVHFTAFANIDSEPGYDYVMVKYQTRDGLMDAVSYDGYLPNEFIDESFTLDPTDFQGEAQNEIVVQVVFESDPAWSDSDCLWPTAGAVQIDDITVTTSQGGGDTVSFSDFQDGWGDWAVVLWQGVGDFTALWRNLDDLDPCSTNLSPQVAFIDDGQVVPGVGPSYCQDWCYGPNGYIVNSTGGLAGTENRIDNVVMSPVMDWPGDSFNGSLFEVGVYFHETLNVDSPGIWVDWAVRSADTIDELGNPTGNSIEDAAWHSDNGAWYGAPVYESIVWYLDDLLVQGLDQVQIRLQCVETGWFGLDGNNGNPAPYFDNVLFSAFSTYGPVGSAVEAYLANDNFPAIGEVDLVNLGNNSVRFDRASTWLNASGLPVAGDEVAFGMEPRRLGAELEGHPNVHFLIDQNPLFNEFRTNPEFGADPAGIVLADSARGGGGVVIPGLWVFDLPDSNFLFPGDVIHYFVTGTDGGGPNGLPWETITVPGDTSGFSDFSGPRAYDNAFTMRALPTVYEDPLNPGQLKTPKALYWNDDVGMGLFSDSFAEWFGAFDNLGLVCGRDFDFYYTNGADNGNGNGIGGRATAYSLIGYEDFIYSSGSVFAKSLSDGDLVDAGNDLGVLDQWLRLGNKDLFMTGDSFLSDISVNCGVAGVQFIEDWIKVNHFNSDIRPLIGLQSTPQVRPIADNGVFQNDLVWIAYGGCPFTNSFDALEADQANGGIRLAEFLSPAGASAYAYSAATLYQDEDTGSRVLTMPYDFSFIYTANQGGKANAPLATRVLVLEQVLGFFGLEGDPLDVTPVPDARKFTVRNYPNPFNPNTKIEYTLAKPCHLSLKVYNVRGELVKTLVDEVKEASGFVMWDGKDHRDNQVASGVYFYEARANGEVKVEKMVMLK